MLPARQTLKIIKLTFKHIVVIQNEAKWSEESK